ncbi:hypothetical protein RB653_001288 [Dictyostelium firmibasis]|uniref:Uncharacterized protein n=1 Tax=Dictyostelium firmibasis TaxID=79012 RepID=A0AAN7YYK0_9MYCE
MLYHKTYEQNYFTALYAQFKIGEFYDIFIDGNKTPIPFVGESESMMLNNSEFQNGSLEFVFLEGKIRKRKNESGFWRQNGSYCDFNYGNSSFGMGKRNFSFQSETIKGRKVLEYSLNFKQKDGTEKGCKIILRHFLTTGVKDLDFIKTCNNISLLISIKPKSNSTSPYLLRESDFFRNINDISDYIYHLKFSESIFYNSFTYDLNELSENSQKNSKRPSDFIIETNSKKNKSSDDFYEVDQIKKINYNDKNNNYNNTNTNNNYENNNTNINNFIDENTNINNNSNNSNNTDYNNSIKKKYSNFNYSKFYFNDNPILKNKINNNNIIKNDINNQIIEID